MKRATVHHAVVDDELEEQLEEADRDHSSVQVVFSLRPADDKHPSFDPSETESKARELIERVGEETGEKVEDYNVFRHLGRFVVQASPNVVRKLIEQQEIARATPNRRESVSANH